MNTLIAKNILKIYNLLFKTYGPQGWWPIGYLNYDPNGKGSNRERGYHPNNYNIPRDDQEFLEIILGTVLTQNTNWNNVVTALRKLASMDCLSMQKMISVDEQILEEAIKSSGYYRQKTKYLKNILSFFAENSLKNLESLKTETIRKMLLQQKGIGPETADCILLYGLKRCSFVVDAYTKRIFSHLGFVDPKIGYEPLKNLFETSLSRDLKIYQEFHALLVQHGKLYYSSKIKCWDDPVLSNEQFV